MTPEEHQAANERITKVCNERHLSYVGSMWPTGDLCLDGDFAADDLRVIADAMDGRQAIREAEAAMKERCVKVIEECAALPPGLPTGACEALVAEIRALE